MTYAAGDRVRFNDRCEITSLRGKTGTVTFTKNGRSLDVCPDEEPTDLLVFLWEVDPLTNDDTSG